MITLHKWYPSVEPKYDVQTAVVDKRTERIQLEHELEIRAQKIRQAIDDYQLELYNKRARVNQLEINMLSNHKRVQIFA